MGTELSIRVHAKHRNDDSAHKVAVDAMALHTPAWRIAPGDIVTTGTITDAWPLEPGQTWSTRLSDERLTALTLRVEP